MVRLILSHTRRPCSGRGDSGSCLDRGGETLLAEHLWDARQRAGCFPYIHSVLTKALGGGFRYPQVTGEETELHKFNIPAQSNARI